MTNTIPKQTSVDPSQLNMADPNWTLFTILKNTWVHTPIISGQAKIPAKINFDTKWWSGAYDAEVHIHPTAGEKVKRWGAGSTKRAHWTHHDVWVWAREIDTRWQIVKGLERILALKADHPTQDIQRIDYWSVDYWEEQDPVGVTTLFRAKLLVQTLWVK
jgi:hypothetical protein